MAADELDEGAALFDFVDELLRDRERGVERPLAEYLARFPGHEQALAREWLALRAEASEPDAAQAADERRVGPWHLVRELGRGGQGAVWLAEDTRIARRVALKLLPEGFALLDADRRARLRREAEALARLDHPAICPVLEAQIEGERPFLAMRLIEGETLAAAIARARTGPDGGALALPPRGGTELATVLAFFEQAARALHAAHEAGVVHRDVKPGNVMVTPAGRPVLLDFGQARDESSTLAARTLSGDVFGTPAYMSPEQVRGRTREIDRRTDVWSLGATLHEALTLERPFEGASVAELALAIDGAPLPPLRERGIPRDLAVVLATALERDLTRRYATALDLAEDLRRVREHEPVRARPAGPLLRLSRWARRHPAVAASLAAVLLALTAGLAWTLHLLAREQQALDWALGSHLAKRTLALIDEDPAAALALGIEAVELAPNYETRSALLGALDACSLESLIEASPARRILDLAVSPDGHLAAAATDVGTIVLFDLEARAPRAELAAGEQPVHAVVFLRSGELVSGGDDGTVRWWDTTSGKVVRQVAGPGGAILGLAVDLAWRRLAVGVAGGRLALLSARDGAQEAGLEQLGCEPDTLRFSADGRHLLAFRRALPGQPAPRDAAAIVVDVEAGRVGCVLGGQGESVSWAELLPGRQAVATASLEGVVRVRSLTDGGPLAEPVELHSAVWCAAASPGGEWLALACEEPSPAGVRTWLWSPWRGALHELGSREQARVVHAVFSPDGARVATSSFDTTVRVYDLRNGSPPLVLRGLVQPLASLWSPNGARLLTLGNANAAPVWLARGRPDVFTLAGHEGAVVRARFSGDGARALTLSEQGTTRLWCTARRPDADGESAVVGELVTELPAVGAGPQHGALFADEQTLVTWGDRAFATWDARSGRPRNKGSYGPGRPRAVEPDPRGRAQARLCEDGRVVLMPFEAPEDESDLLPFGPLEAQDATCVAWSRDGLRVAVGTSSGELRVFNRERALLGSWSPEVEPGVDAGVVDLVFAPDGEALALACGDRKVRFVAVGTTLEQLRPPLIVFPPLAIDWSADGTRLLVVGTEGRGAFRLHDLVHDRQVALEVFHGANLTCGEFSPDGTLVLSGSLDGTVYVRSALDGTPVARLMGHAGAVIDASFSDDDGPLRVISASSDGTARVWPVDPLPPARARMPRELKEWERKREARLAEPLRFR